MNTQSQTPKDPFNPKPQRIPQANNGHVIRPTLSRPLASGTQRLTFLCAPAGFGKSALMIECARQAPAGTRIIWLEMLGHSMSSRDLLNRVAAELGEEVEDGEPLESLHRLLGRIREPLWLMLDDYPRQACPELDACMEDLIDRTPNSLHWWVSSRRRPSWSLPRLVLQGAVREVRAPQLAFDSLVLQELIRERQQVFSQELRKRLLEECEQWPALICLMLHESNSGNLLQNLRNGTPLLLNYLQREVTGTADNSSPEVAALRRRHPLWFNTTALAPNSITYAVSGRAQQPANGICTLSKRERTILQLIASGLSNREIANQLCLSVNTVKAHAWNINSKLGTERRTQAVAQAQLQGLLN
ncbi:LuxR C-terminal-related transcriptional regulator [Ectopseudomonas mendocina]|uniref:LuxR C-terminal-related transcriptional regulator n=1 Tax=Ectopseudomonas mendocina TaxID=300 RepID=A0ABZ2RLD4_ECTME